MEYIYMISILFNQFLLERIPNEEQEKSKQMNWNNIAVMGGGVML